MISEVGFLSPEVNESEQQLAMEYRDLFELSERLSKLFIQLLRDAPLDHESVRNMVLNTLAAKALELFQSSVILLRKDVSPQYEYCAVRKLRLSINSARSNWRLRESIDTSIKRNAAGYRSSGVSRNTNKRIQSLELPPVLRRKSILSQRKGRRRRSPTSGLRWRRWTTFTICTTKK